MKSLIIGASVVSAYVRPDIPLGENCTLQYELAQVQDVTQSFADDIVEMQSFIVDFVNEFTQRYPGSRFGLSAFADKPIPYTGYGTFASLYPGTAWDFCYNTVQKLTDQANIVLDAVNALYTSGGNDVPENQIGAFLEVALGSGIGWSPYTHDPKTGRPILRVALMVTDSISHVAGQAQSNIDLWNNGWGLVDQMATYNFDYGECNVESTYWADLVALGPKYRDDPTSLTASESTKFAAVLDKCGPYPYPNVLPHPGTPNADCVQYDYPSIEQMTNSIKAMNIIPVVLTPASNIGGLFEWLQSWDACPNATTEAQCLADWYRALFADSGIEGVFMPLEDGSVDLMATMLAALEEISNAFCLVITTEEPTTTTTTSVTDLTVEPEGSTLPTTTTTTFVDTTTTTSTEPTTTTTFIDTTTTTSTEPTTTTTFIDTTTTTSTEPTTTTTFIDTTTTTSTEPTTTTVDTTTSTSNEPTTTATTTKSPCGCHSGSGCLCKGEIEIKVKNLGDFLDHLKNLN